MEQVLRERSGDTCELCAGGSDLAALPVPPEADTNPDRNLWACRTCREQVEKSSPMQAEHWRCLGDSMWSETAAVQVQARRLLTRLKSESWAQEYLDMLYLDEELVAWADAVVEDFDEAVSLEYFDAHGARLEAGDTVTIIKDLPVKGGGFTAKRGTAVRNITLDRDNVEQIEGRVNSQLIVILTKYVKKA